MHKVLLPVDGSLHAFEATLYLIGFNKQHGPMEVHVLTVEQQSPQRQAAEMDTDTTDSERAVQSHIVISQVLHALNEAGVEYHSHIKNGDPAATIVALAEELGCDTIFMGTRGLGRVASFALGSVTSKVLMLTKLPIVCIRASDSISRES